MKKITTSLAIIFAALMFSTEVSAQKIAHLRVDSLLTLMPEAKKAEAIAQDFLKQFEKEIASMNTEFQTKYADYMANQASYSDLVRKNKEEELQMLQQRIEAFKEQAQQEYQNKNAELSRPIYDKAKKGIEAVAKEGGYKYVIDTSSGVVLYSEPSDDILLLVKKKLDSMPEAVLPGAPVKETPKTPTPKANPTPTKTGGK
jgi:outer membrane protein